TSIKDYYLEDCAVQTWVAEGAGVPIKKVTLAYVNNRFVYRGKGNYQGLLSHEDITAQVFEHVPMVEQWVTGLRKVLNGREPAIRAGNHCNTPYACPFQDYCRSKEPAPAEHPVGLLPHSGALVERMAALSVDDLRDVPPSALKNALHRRIQQAHISGQPYLDPAAGQDLSNRGW